MNVVTSATRRDRRRNPGRGRVLAALFLGALLACPSPSARLVAQVPAPPPTSPRQVLPDFDLPPLPGEVPTPAATPGGDEATAVEGLALPSLPESPPVPPAPADDAVATVACATCNGTGLLGASGGGLPRGCSTCGGSGCVPGRKPGQAIEAHTPIGRFLADLYECLCCPDPCYLPRWEPAANASFFVDAVRPRTMQRIRWDRGWNMAYPDRSEYFWARQQLIGPISLRVPGAPNFRQGGSGPGAPRFLGQAAQLSPEVFARRFPSLVQTNPLRYPGVPSLDFNVLSYYQEAATERASAFVDITYRTVNPRFNEFHAGFSNVNIGTKGMILDTELLQLTFQFVTMIPIGTASKGLSNGHVSLEPSLIGALRLAPETYLQGQLAEWIPIGGDTHYQGSILRYGFSFNHVLYHFAADSPLIGTLEFSGWSFQDGAYTDPYALTPQFRKSSGATYFSIGPGLRASICDYLDFGAAVLFPVSDQSWGDPWLRAEIRILF